MDRTCEPARAIATMLDINIHVNLVHHDRIGGLAQIPLAIGRVFEELPVFRQIAFGRRDMAVGLDAVGPERTAAGGDPAMIGRPGQDHVVAGTDLEMAEGGFDHRGAGLDKHAFVAGRIAINRRSCARDDIRNAHIAVAKHEPAAGNDINIERVVEQVMQFEVAGEQRLIGRRRLIGECPFANSVDRRRHATVIEQRRVGGKALFTHQLFVVELAVKIAVLRMTLGRDVSRPVVVGHDQSTPALTVTRNGVTRNCPVWPVRARSLRTGLGSCPCRSRANRAAR